MQSIDQVAAIRARLWDAGFRPVPVLNADHPDPVLAGKAPLGRGWGDRARNDPPDCLRYSPVPHALNTGILCDGLRAIDIDIDDPEIAARCRSFVVQRFGEAPIRMRRNSSRCLILYRAAEGEPKKLVLAGTAGKIEVLGKGQQFVAFGKHPTGADLEWFPDGPGQETMDALPAIREADLAALFGDLAPIIGASELPPTNGHGHSSADPQADPLRIAAALNDIPNNKPADWEWWNRVGMAIWRATGGSEIGWQAFDAWSSRHPSYDATHAKQRWDHYFTSPPTEIGAGTLFRMAKEARAASPDPEPTPEPQPAPDASPFPLLWFSEIQPILDARDFVQGVLMEQGSAVVYGQSNSGKTFWTTDLALHIAAGVEWNGRRVQQGGVVYCVLEGGIGFSNRVWAWREEHGYQAYDLPFAAIQSPIRLLDPEAKTDELIEAIRYAATKMSVPVRLVVIDTLARALGGANENAPEDMGALVAAMDRIRAETGAMVLFVHHSGKDQAKGARGHSSLQAAIDTEIEVVDTELNGVRIATVAKQREFRKGDEFPFTLRVSEVGENRFNEPVTTCLVEVVDADQASAPLRKTRNLPDNQHRAMELLTDLLARTGQPGHAGTPSGVLSVPADWWRQNFYERAMPGQEQDTKKKAFGRASGALIRDRLVGMAGNRVWIVQMHGRDTPSDHGEGE